LQGQGQSESLTSSLNKMQGGKKDFRRDGEEKDYSSRQTMIHTPYIPKRTGFIIKKRRLEKRRREEFSSLRIAYELKKHTQKIHENNATPEGKEMGKKLHGATYTQPWWGHLEFKSEVKFHH